MYIGLLLAFANRDISLERAFPRLASVFTICNVCSRVPGGGSVVSFFEHTPIGTKIKISAAIFIIIIVFLFCFPVTFKSVKEMGGNS